MSDLPALSFDKLNEFMDDAQAAVDSRDEYITQLEKQLAEAGDATEVEAVRDQAKGLQTKLEAVSKRAQELVVENNDLKQKLAKYEEVTAALKNL